MTGYFDGLGTLVNMAKKDPEIAKVFLDVVPKIMKEITCEYNQAIRFYLIDIEELSFRQWNDFISDVHDLDHKTDHKVFSRKGYNLLSQLLSLFGLGCNPYEPCSVEILWKNQYRSLFKYSDVAKEYFMTNYKHISGTTWMKKEIKK